jgi:Cytochrome C'
MKTHLRTMVAGMSVVGLGLVFLAVSGRSQADEAGNIRDAVQKAANALASGDDAAAQKIANDLAKSVDQLEDVMNLMSRRTPTGKGGLGVGKQGEFTPDSIEGQVQNLSKKPLPAQRLDKESDALAEMAYRIEAISEVARAKAPEKDEGAKKKKDYLEWAGDMKKAAQELAEAAKSKDPKKVKNAAANLNNACNNCHGVFRD